MFVRWQQFRRTKRRSLSSDSDRLRAVLVEAVRVDGKPRQKHVAVLGSVVLQENWDKYGEQRRAGRIERFWVEVTRRLQRLDNRLSDSDRERIVSTINERVEGRLLNDAELAEHDRKLEQLLASLRAMGAALARSRPPRRRRRTQYD